MKTEPLSKTFTKDELIEKARAYVRQRWTREGEIPYEHRRKHDRDLLCVAVFIFDLFDGKLDDLTPEKEKVRR